MENEFPKLATKPKSITCDNDEEFEKQVFDFLNSGVVYAKESMLFNQVATEGKVYRCFTCLYYEMDQYIAYQKEMYSYQQEQKIKQEKLQNVSKKAPKQEELIEAVSNIN